MCLKPNCFSNRILFEFKNIVSLACISLSIFFPRLERNEIGRQLLRRLWSSFLKSEIAFTLFRFVGKIPDENDRLAKRSIGSPCSKQARNLKVK